MRCALFSGMFFRYIIINGERRKKATEVLQDTIDMEG